ncbi:type III restriction endonuclease subunit R [Candidatus Poribacteria bacterium]|nr:type III restriction endonuclease subunit R [Candidatus Poribacteria bacterium]MYG07174.1 type III restriction endonuclease subunit R [Candidatus Poribacteria bacterium]MYK22712.1 type III restriction endonuclease subunit R [Candidatus Poribacteria bacterium]
MALHPNFPESPHEIVDPSVRWLPDQSLLFDLDYGMLLPPLVQKIREQVKTWRDDNYSGASETSKALLNWWFNELHLREQTDNTVSEFQYYFAQREAIETIIYLYDVVEVRDKFDLMRFDSSGAVSTGLFDEDWRRFVIKMATGTGKTKVMSLAIAWSFFHKLYESDSELSRNFLVIAPNIIVLDRLYHDFQGLRIFFEDPVLPDNGFEGRDWRNDFQLTLHVQDEVRTVRPTGNIFLTNIHRVYSSDQSPPAPNDENSMDYFLGKKPTGATTDSKVDLGYIVRDIDELMILNDEAHHVHNPKLAWFKSIEDIHNRLLQKGSELALQVDVTATPKHSNGAIFVQTVSDYPLVEAISQNVVKRPVLPDAKSRAKLDERQSVKYTEKYADYLELGVVEWRKAYAEHEKLGKKAILFVMTDNTQNCDEVAAYLQNLHPALKDAVLVIHTNKSGEISEAKSSKKQAELEKLRKQANDIDSLESPYKAIVSVLMLKEGWDVKNVTTIVGLRAYSAKPNILPEQTLGRGLRLMYAGTAEETVSVIGTDAFMEFVESIKSEGVELERQPMGEGTKPKAPIVIEVDKTNVNKDIDALDIEIPILTRRIYREYTNLTELDVTQLDFSPVTYQPFGEAEIREIVFKDMTTGEVTHTTVMDSNGVADYRSVVGYFAETIRKDLRLVSGYDVLYGKVKDFVQHQLFGETVMLEDPNTLQNLSELPATKTVMETFKYAINDLTIQDRGDAQLSETTRVQDARPFMVKEQDYLVPQKSVLNRITGDLHFELEFAAFLENCPDVVSYAKNYFALHFKLDYINADGDISNYYPDFLVKLTDGQIIVVETKGWEDLDVPLKMQRLSQWCEDVNKITPDVDYDFVYVDQEGFDVYTPQTFQQLIDGFTEYKTQNLTL